MPPVKSLASRVAIVFLVTTACGCPKRASEPPSLRTVKASNALVTLPEQGWSDSDAEWFYSVAQGSRLIPYEWASALKMQDGKNFLESLPDFGYIERTPSRDNPLGLPVGFTKEEGESRNWLGLNCAACHTTLIEYGSKTYLIDGGPALADIGTFLTKLEGALTRTADDDEWFIPFSRKVLGDNASDNKRTAALREDVRNIAKIRKEYNDRNMPARDATQFGYGRVDAIGAILNEVTVKLLEMPSNHKAADAPVSYPFLWDTPHHDKVEWNGSAPNTIFDFGNLARNTGEVIGVFGDVVVPPRPPRLGYQSSVRFGNLMEIESKLRRLKSPQWPADIPRSTEAAVLARGQQLFENHCASCHKFEVGDRDDEDRKIVAKMDDVGTDPKMAENFRLREVQTGPKLFGSDINFLPPPLGGKFGEDAAGETVLVHVVIGTMAGFWKEEAPDQLDRLKRRPPELKARETDNKYKGRPLNGIWATAPYLHNGSVPTLRDLMKPTSERPKAFWVGSRRFNAVDVGFETTESPGTSLFDTTLEGNSNAGHEYGTGVSEDDGGDGNQLSPAEVEALLEYLKSL